MNKINPENLNKILSEQASDEEVRKFDQIFKEMPLEHSERDFTESVIQKFQKETHIRKSPSGLNLIALSIIILISLVIILMYDSFSIPSMSDPMLEQWMMPVNESTGLIKHIILIMDSILMLLLIDKFALGPYFGKKNYS